MMIKERNSLSREQIKKLSGMIEENLHKLECIKQAEFIMAYYPHRNEPDILGLIHKLIDMKKTIYLPCVTGEWNIKPGHYTSGCDMKKNVYGIPEPFVVKENNNENPEVILVPGIAFDEKLYRLGFGAGYYDRFLDSIEAIKIGVCYDFQIVRQIETKQHDVPVDLLVTEKRKIGDMQCVS